MRKLFIAIIFALLFSMSLFAQERRFDFIQTCGISAVNGTIPAAVSSYVATSERGSCYGARTTVINIRALPQTVVNGTEFEGNQIYTFPEGRIYILGATATIQQTTTSVLASTINASVTEQWGFGTATASATTLAGTMQDLVPVTNVTTSATINVAGTATSAALASGAQFDGTSTAKKIFLNTAFATTTDVDADGTQALTGTLTITWIWLGDY